MSIEVFAPCPCKWNLWSVIEHCVTFANWGCTPCFCERACCAWLLSLSKALLMLKREEARPASSADFAFDCKPEMLLRSWWWLLISHVSLFCDTNWFTFCRSLTPFLLSASPMSGLGNNGICVTFGLPLLLHRWICIDVPVIREEVVPVPTFSAFWALQRYEKWHISLLLKSAGTSNI